MPLHTASTTLYTIKLVPAQRLSLPPKHPSLFPQNIWGSHSYQRTQPFLFYNSRHTNQPFSIHSLCATFNPFNLFQSLHIIIIFFTSTSAESQRCYSVGMLIYFAPVHPWSISLEQIPSESLFHCSTAVKQCIGLTV